MDKIFSSVELKGQLPKVLLEHQVLLPITVKSSNSQLVQKLLLLVLPDLYLTTDKIFSLVELKGQLPKVLLEHQVLLPITVKSSNSQLVQKLLLLVLLDLYSTMGKIFSLVEPKDQLIISLEPLVSSPTRDSSFSFQLVSLLFQLVLLELSSPMVKTSSLCKDTNVNSSLVLAKIW